MPTAASAQGTPLDQYKQMGGLAAIAESCYGSQAIPHTLDPLVKKAAGQTSSIDDIMRSLVAEYDNAYKKAALDHRIWNGSSQNYSSAFNCSDADDIKMIKGLEHNFVARLTSDGAETAQAPQTQTAPAERTQTVIQKSRGNFVLLRESGVGGAVFDSYLRVESHRITLESDLRPGSLNTGHRMVCTMPIPGDQSRASGTMTCPGEDMGTITADWWYHDRTDDWTFQAANGSQHIYRRRPAASTRPLHSGASDPCGSRAIKDAAASELRTFTRRSNPEGQVTGVSRETIPGVTCGFIFRVLMGVNDPANGLIPQPMVVHLACLGTICELGQIETDGTP